MARDLGFTTKKRKHFFSRYKTWLILPSFYILLFQSLQAQHIISLDDFGPQPRRSSYLPVTDTLRTLVIFAEYAQELSPSETWPGGRKEPPEFGKTLFASSAEQIPPQSLTAYFKEASMNRFCFLGDYYPDIVRLDSSLEYYHGHGQTASIVYDVIDKVYKSGKVDWSRYDKWKKKGETWVKEPDGVLDNMIIIFRDDPQKIDAGRYAWTGTGGGIAALLCQDYRVNDQLRISGASMGSGLIVHLGRDHLPRVIKLVKHELAHFFTIDHYAGLNGFWGTDFTLHGSWGLAAAHGSSSICVNAWDRDQLGWAAYRYDFQEALKRDTILELMDFVSTGDAARIKLPYTSNEYFLLEYHNNSSLFDHVDLDQDGLYILHQTGGPPDHLDCEEADGRWDFVMADSVKCFEPCCGEVPMVKRLEANPFLGFGDRDDVRTIKDPNQEFSLDNMHRALVFAVEGEEHRIHVDGDGGDAFIPERGRDDFGIDTNPSSASNGIKMNKPLTRLNGIRVKVLSMEKAKIRVRIGFHDFNMRQDCRWTGNILLRDSLHIHKRRTLLLDQSATYVRYTGALPVTQLMLDSASISLDARSTLILKGNSTLVLAGNSFIYLGENARLIIYKGSRIIGEQSRIIKSKGARIIYR